MTLEWRLDTLVHRFRGLSYLCVSSLIQRHTFLDKTYNITFFKY